MIRNCRNDCTVSDLGPVPETVTGRSDWSADGSWRQQGAGGPKIVPHRTLSKLRSETLTKFPCGSPSGAGAEASHFHVDQRLVPARLKRPTWSVSGVHFSS